MNSRPLLITSNGFGMGHLVRQLAISRHFDNAVILTLSGAAPLALNNGAYLEYCPSYTTPWISKRAWHRSYLQDRIVLLAQEINADVLVFDGVVPYVGLLNAMKELDLPAVWMRRGVWRSSAKRWPLRYASQFDLVIEPGDIGRSHDQGPTRALPSHRVSVITEAGQTLPRDKAAAALGVDPSKKTLLINVGSTSGVDFSKVRFPSDWNVIATSDALGRQRSTADIRTISGLFPLHPYLSAVDLAVTSVGYNAAHEFVACAVPTIVVPSDNATDDQYARADAMVSLGVSRRANSASELAVDIALWSGDDHGRALARQQAIEVAKAWGDGAKAAASLIAGAARVSHRTPLRLRLRNFAECLLAVTDRKVAPSSRFTQALSPEMMKGRELIEHTLPGTSSLYLQKRQKLAEKRELTGHQGLAKKWLERGKAR